MLYNPNWKPKVTAIGQILLDAATILEVDGWCQGKMLNSRGERCAIGALTSVNGSFLDQVIAHTHLTNFLGQNIPAWNDQPGQTLEAVTDTLRTAARSAP